MRFIWRVTACLCCVVAAGCRPQASSSRPTRSGQVPVADGVWYSLEDGEERHRRDPDTFSIPPRGARESLKPGQIVKLLFAIVAGGDEQIERMWVIVQRGDGDEYIGVLDNQPVSTDKMRSGMVIRFQARHVIAIHPERAGG